MEKQKVLSTLTRIGVIPVVRAESADNVVRAVEALAEGGIPVAEITMTVPGAIQVIQRCSDHFGDRITLGAGSVTSAGICASAIDAGSVFIVSPVFKAEVIEVCNRRNVCMVHEPLPQIPLTPTGGVSLESLADYFKAGVPFVGAGGDLVSKKAINSGDLPAVTERARQYVAAIRAARSQLFV